jgi:hypothetical protein
MCIFGRYRGHGDDYVCLGLHFLSDRGRLAKEYQHVLRRSSGTEQWHRKWRPRQTETYLSQHTYCRGYTQIWGQSAKQMKKLREPECRRPLTHGPWEYCSMPLASDRHPCAVHLILSPLPPPIPWLTLISDDFWNKT